MGNTQSLPIDSYLDRHPCSGRNITWQYIHNNGSLPAPYSSCPYTYEILSSHCCADGACTPSWFDREYGRYPYANWDGLGDPYNNITRTTIGDWHNGTSNSSVVSGNNRVERPARGGMCLGMEPSLWYAGYHWPPLGLDGRPVENFRQMKWGDSSNRNDKQQQAVGSNASARNGRLEHRVVTSGAAPMKTITISRLATYVLADLKVALWKMGTLMNTLGFFMGILVGYLICLKTNGGLPEPIESQLSQLRALQTEATGPQTSTAKTSKKKKKSRNKNVASQQDGLQVPNDLNPAPASPPTPALQDNDPEVSNIPVPPQAPRDEASENDLQVPDLPLPSQASRNGPSQNDDQVTDLPAPPQTPRDGASESNDPQVSDVPLRSQTPWNVVSQQDGLQVPIHMTPAPTSPPTPAPQDNVPEVSDVPTHPQAPRNGPSQDDDLQVSDVPIGPQTPRDAASQHDDCQISNVPVPPQAPRDGASQRNDPQVSDVQNRPPTHRNVANQLDDLQILNFPPIRPQAPRNGASQNSNPQVLTDLTPPISPWTPAPQNYFPYHNNFTPWNVASQSSDPQIFNHLASPFSPPTLVPQNNYLAVGNSSTPRYNVRERRRLYVDWGSLRRTDNAGSQPPIGTRPQQGSQSASQRVWQQGSRVDSTDSDSEQVGAQHRNPWNRPPQRLS